MKKKSKLICMLISLIASLFCWAYVVTVVSTEKTETFYNIPVIFSGADVLREKGLTVTKGADVTVSLQLTGRRTVMQDLNRDNITLSVDVSKINAAGEYSLNYNIGYPNSIQASSLTVNRRSPSTVSITVEDLSTREIPVKVAFQGTVAEGYLLDSTVPAFDSISVTGTSGVVDQIASALIIVDDAELSTSFTRNMEFTLVDGAGEPVDKTGIELEMETVGVTVNVVKHKEVPLVVEFTAGGGATEENIKWKANPSTIMVSGDEKLLDGLNQIVLGRENLAEIVADSTQTYPIVLPDGVKNESGEVEATVTLALSGLSSTTVRVTSFEFTNVPTGFHADAVTESLQITVRGPSEDIKSITAADVRVVVDLSNISGVAGSYTINNVGIYLNSHPTCGVLGSYSVMTTLITEADYLASLTENAPDSPDDIP